MSSRIIAGEHHATAVRPMAWRTRTTAPQNHDRHVPTDAALLQLQAKLAELQQNMEARIAEAHHAGFEAGAAEAQRSLDAEVRPLVQGMAAEIERFSSVRTTLLADAEEGVVTLAFAVARRILHRELTMDPGAIQGIVTAAIHLLRGHRVLRVRVHPRLESFVRSTIERADMLGDAVEIVADRSVGSDGLLFETDRGNLDASVQAQLDEIRHGLSDGISR